MKYSEDKKYAGKEAQQKIQLAYGHELTIESSSQSLSVFSPHEGQHLTIQFTEAGMTVQLAAAKCNLSATEEIAFQAPRIKLNASQNLQLSSQGHMVTQVAKDNLTETGGTNKSLAQDQKIVATVGNVTVKANDDVTLDGERVLLNS